MSENDSVGWRLRAEQTGTLWLNDIFAFREIDNPLRLGPFGRTSPVELIWFVLIFAITFGFMYMYRQVMLMIDFPFSYFYSWITVILASLIAGYRGRKLAHTSPLRRSTGEGMGTYLRLRVGAFNDRIRWIRGTPTTYNMYETRMQTNDGKIKVMPAIEWLGSQQAPRAPHNLEPVILPSPDNDYDPPAPRTADHIFYPRGYDTGLIYQMPEDEGAYLMFQDMPDDSEYQSGFKRQDLMNSRLNKNDHGTSRNENASRNKTRPGRQSKRRTKKNKRAKVSQ